MSVLGYNPFIDPQSPATPISTNFLRDEFDAVDTVEKDATGEQRVIAIGSSIPIVFCKFADNSGGTWVSPPAARYGLQLSDTLENSFALGLVISEGEIGGIDSADVYKGAFKLSDLSDTGITNSFGSMPTEGYDYSFSNTTTTPGNPGTPDEEIIEKVVDSEIQINYSAFASSISYSTAFTFFDTSALSFTIRVVDDARVAVPTAYIFGFRVTVNGVTVEESIGTLSSSYSFSHDNNNVSATYRVQVTDAFDYIPSFPDIVLSPFARESLITTIIPGEPATLPVYTTVGLPLSPGSGGTFANMSCLAVRGAYTQDASIGDYKEQIRCFVRNGIKVESVEDGTIDSSDNFMDLAYYLLKANKISDALIDLDGFKIIRNFLSENKLRFNGTIANAVNMREFFTAVAPGLMLRFVQDSGKFSFKSALPLSANGRINTGTVSPVKTFTADNILANSLTKTYYDSHLHKPICVLISWREQFAQAYSVAVTTEIRYTDSALEGPYESYDFSDFITDVNHATLVGKYILSSRARTTHAIRFSTFFDTNAGGEKLAGQLQPMDIIRVNFTSSTQQGSFEINDAYQVVGIAESIDGSVQIDAIHFPVDEGGASLIAADMFGDAYAVS